MKVIEIVEFVYQQLTAATDLCNVAISCFPGSSAPCTVPVTAARLGSAGIHFTLKVAVSISERIYAEIAGAQDAAYESDRQMAMYENIITNHRNIITTFMATQQLKVMLGEISEDLANDDEDEGKRRRLNDGCKSTKNGFVLLCDKPSCEDPTRWVIFCIIYY